MVTPSTSPRSAVTLVLAAVVSVQLGSALAATLVPRIGWAPTVLLRLGVSVLILGVVARPRWRARPVGDWVTVAAFGLSLAVMNAAFYAAIARLPLGVAVTVEFIGPLLLAAVLSRRRQDLAAVALAALGVVAISQPAAAGAEAGGVDLVGVGLALLAGAAWAGYIILSARTGARFAGIEGLTMALMVASLVVLPFGLHAGVASYADPAVLAVGAGVGILSSVLPYSLELLALRRLPPRVFGVLLSLEPAVAAASGFAVLGQRLSLPQIAGMSLVVIASAATTRSAGGPSGQARPGDPVPG